MFNSDMNYEQLRDETIKVLVSLGYNPSVNLRGHKTEIGGYSMNEIKKEILRHSGQFKIAMQFLIWGIIWMDCPEAAEAYAVLKEAERVYTGRNR